MSDRKDLLDKIQQLEEENNRLRTEKTNERIQEAQNYTDNSNGIL